MERGHDRRPQPAHHLQHFQLVADIKVVRGFIQNDQPRFLCKGARDHDALTLAARQRAKGAMGQMMQAHPLQRVIDHMQIARRWPGKGAAMGRAAQRDDLGHREREIGGLFLQNGGHALRDGAGAHAVDIAAIQQNAPLGRAMKAIDQPQERGFPRPVRTQNAQHPTGCQRQADGMQDAAAPCDALQFKRGGGGGGAAHCRASGANAPLSSTRPLRDSSTTPSATCQSSEQLRSVSQPSSVTAPVICGCVPVRRPASWQHCPSRAAKA